MGPLVWLSVLVGCSALPGGVSLGPVAIPAIPVPAVPGVDVAPAAAAAVESLAEASERLTVALEAAGLTGELDGDGVAGAEPASAGASEEPDVHRPAPGEHPQPKKGFKPVGPKPDGINQVGETSWTVTRALADHWMKDPYALGNARESGAGWQLFAIRTKAAYHLGMRNGDIVIEANGHKLDTKPQLLAAYLDLKNDREFDVTFLRAGRTLHHHYAIRGE